jgi:hypothetical protein
MGNVSKGGRGKRDDIEDRHRERITKQDQPNAEKIY